MARHTPQQGTLCLGTCTAFGVLNVAARGFKVLRITFQGRFKGGAGTEGRLRKLRVTKGRVTHHRFFFVATTSGR
eukprot:1659012-Amphidinium_carterae.1